MISRTINHNTNVAKVIDISFVLCTTLADVTESFKYLHLCPPRKLVCSASRNTHIYICVCVYMHGPMPNNNSSSSSIAGGGNSSHCVCVVETGTAHSFLCVSRQSLPHSVRRRSIPRQRTREYHLAAAIANNLRGRTWIIIPPRLTRIGAGKCACWQRSTNKPVIGQTNTHTRIPRISCEAKINSVHKALTHNITHTLANNSRN